MASELSDILKRVNDLDPAAGDELRRQIDGLTNRRANGLNFERHLPEQVALVGRPISMGDKVRFIPTRGATAVESTATWVVTGLTGPKGKKVAELLDRATGDTATRPVDDLVFVADFRDPIYPGLKSTGWAEVLDDGGVVLASAMGAGRAGADTTMEPHEVRSDRAEAFVADFMALLWATSQTSGPGRYDVQIEVRWEGPDPVIMRIPDRTLGGYYLDEEYSVPIRRFVPVRTVVDTSVSEEAFVDHLRELALDVVNQGGAQHLHSILPSTDVQ